MAWAAGTMCMHQLSGPPGPVPIVALLLASLGAWKLLGWRWAVWFVAAAVWTIGLIHVRLADRLAPELEGADVKVSGWVDGFAREGDGQTSFSLRVDASHPQRGVPGRLRLTWYDPPTPIRPAEAFELTVRLKAPRGLANPGGFDYERWLFQEGYGATGYVRGGRPLDEQAMDARRRWLKFRAGLARRIERSAPTADAAALLAALTIGERYDFDEGHWRALRRTGTSHLVAISGLHVGLVAGFVFFLCRRLILRCPAPIALRDLEIAALASLTVASAYAALAGFTVPTQRALIMLLVALAALVSRRSIGMTGGLATALLGVLVWDPFAPLSASFWLSFLAVGLLWRLARSEHQSRSPFEWLRGLTRVQLSLTLGLVPFVAWFFREVSLISPVVNLLAIPLFGFLLVPLALLAVAMLHLHGSGEWLLAIVGHLMQWTWDWIVTIGEWPWAATTVNALPWWAMALSCSGVLAALGGYPLPARHLGWVALLPIFFPTVPRLLEGGAVVEILDVGHGLAVMVETRNHTLLYDAGPRYRSGFDAGREIVLPAMRARGWSFLDVLLVSHADNDHAGGAEAILDAYPDTRVIAGPDVVLEDAVVCEAGQTWDWDGVAFVVLHPEGDFRRRGNESSCVLRIDSRTGSLLLTGDIEAAGERRLLSQPGELRADVVVVPHHGSATSSSPGLVSAVGAAHALVSAGYRNQWGFPKSDVVRRWEGAGTQLITTGDAGAIRVVLGSADGIRIERRRALRRRYWSAAWDDVWSPQ